MKVLLLTDIPPCRTFPTGREIERLCGFFPRDSVACFAVTSRFIEARTAPELEWISTGYSTNRNEYAYRPFRGIRSFPIAWSVETLHRHFSVPKVAASAIAFGREQRAELVWAVLRGQTLIQIAPRVARKIGAPLVTHVWDSPLPLLFEHQLDRFSRRATLVDFDRAIAASTACATASEGMAADYENRYGTRCVPLYLNSSEDWSQAPSLDDFPRATIEIGVSAIADGPAEWLQLLRALNSSGWQVRGRPVRVNVIGAVAPGEAKPGCIRYFGWRSPAETVEILSQFDILYLPIRFMSGLSDAPALGLPAAFSQYLAAGRPIMLHGPATAAASDYLRRHEAGCVVPDHHAAAIYNALCRLVDSPSEYRRLGKAAGQAFKRDFALTAVRSNFQRVLDLTTADVRAK